MPARTLVPLLAVALVTLSGCASSSSSEEALDALDDDEGQSTASAATARKLPSFSRMWSAYPNGEAEDVKDRIGGQVDADWITNTCTIRLSHALNQAGFPVPKGTKQFPFAFNTITGRDKTKNYAFRVAEFRNYLTHTFGAPTVTVKNPTGKIGVDPARFAGKKGIILFRVPGWNDATGHADLWNGQRAAHEDYFEQASSVQLWEAP